VNLFAPRSPPPRSLSLSLMPQVLADRARRLETVVLIIIVDVAIGES
jgi:hypothetical protein